MRPRGTLTDNRSPRTEFESRLGLSAGGCVHVSCAATCPSGSVFVAQAECHSQGRPKRPAVSNVPGVMVGCL